MNTKNRITELQTLLRQHNHHYYVLATPTISDRQFDTLLQELQTLENQHPHLITPDSPTQRIGGQPIQSFQTRPHAQPMLSLDNSYNKTDLHTFDTRLHKLLPNQTITYLVEPKIDGVAVSLRYENGLLTHALSRGDGRSGDDITSNIKTIRSIPLTLRSDNPPPILEIRGELFMTKSGFATLNQQRQIAGLDAFANPRNACAGSLKLLDPRTVAKRPLDALFYGTGQTQGITFPTHTALLNALTNWGFKTHQKTWDCSDIEQAIQAIDHIHQLYDTSDYDMDGAVIKVQQRPLYQQLGNTSKAPRWAIAYKYEPQQAETTLQEISIQVGRTGVLTPVAELQPVQLSGSTVSRATLHNEQEIQRKDIRIGDRVIVQKAGEIIPAILSVNLKARTGQPPPFTMPQACPICHTPVIRIQDEVAVRCPNRQCPAQIKNWIRHFASRKAMDIDGLGDTLVEQLVEAQLLNSPADLYQLNPKKIANLERMGEKSAENLMQGLKKSKTNDLWRLIHALGIRHVGERSAQTLETAFPDLHALTQADPETLENLDDIGPILAKSIHATFQNPAIQTLLESLQKAGLNFNSPTYGIGTNTHSPFSGKTIVITGTLESLTRSEAAEIIKTLGGKTSSSISKKTDFLLAGKKAGSKLSKAETLNVPILSEETFLKITSK